MLKYLLASALLFTLSCGSYGQSGNEIPKKKPHRTHWIRPDLV